MITWTITKDVAQYGDANPGPVWTNEVRRGHGLTLDQAKAIAEADPSITFFFYFNPGTHYSNLSFGGKGSFSPQDAVFFSGQPWWGSAPGIDGYVKHAEPVNMVWVGSESIPPGTDYSRVINDLMASEYSHVMVCFLHFDPGTPFSPGDLHLVFNGPNAVGQYGDFWTALRQLKQGPSPKKVMISIGGWGSGTWASILNQESDAARMLAKFVKDWDFDGVDLNFEGPLPGFQPWQNSLSQDGRVRNEDSGFPWCVYRNDPRWLEVVARFAIALRNELPDKAITLAPIFDNVLGEHGQLTAIDRVLKTSGRTWRDIISWVNVQFYMYSGEHASPRSIAASGFLEPTIHPWEASTVDEVLMNETLFEKLTAMGLPAEKLVAGFPLNGPRASGPTAAEFNPNELNVVYRFITNRRKAGRPIGGAFVWNYDASVIPADLRWPGAVASALRRTPAS